MGASPALMGRLVEWNNRNVRRVDNGSGNPLPVDGLPWVQAMVGAHPRIRAEWDAFRSRGGSLPRIEDVVDESQGNEGPWRAGLLVSRGRRCEPMASAFPETIAALGSVPHLRSALWSVLDPGTDLPEHVGPNAGVLRFHLGVDCGADSALQVGATLVRYGDAEAVLFDDTVAHSAWNHGERPRVTLFCELLRPLPLAAAVANRAVQGILGLDPRYRRAPGRAAEWHRALNRG